MIKPYPCEFFDSEESELLYPRDYEPETEKSQVSFGSRFIECDCRKHPNGRNVICISTNLAEQLGIPDYISSLCLFDDEDAIYLGPLVGIFTSGFTPFQMNPVGARTSIFAKQMSVQSSVGAVPFLFGEKHIDWENGMIQGLFFDGKTWEKRTVPFPHVIYDRLPNRQIEKHPATRIVKEKLENDYLIPWYNPGFFNKLELYERLCNDVRAEPYLPETHLFTSFSEIERMVAEYGHVYLKQADGSHGHHIRQVLYDREKDVYYCRFFDNRSRLFKFGSIENLIEYFYGNEKLEQLIVQQGIRLLRMEKRPVDFRVHVNKDHDGNWTVTAIAGKIAGAGSPTSHIQYGGKVLSLHEIFTDKEELELNRQKLEKAAMDLAFAIEDNIGGIVGEIGFDLGIDRDGKVWMFEANSKPGRHIFSHPALKESDYLTRQLALSFAIHLTEKTIKTPELIWTN